MWLSTSGEIPSLFLVFVYLLFCTQLKIQVIFCIKVLTAGFLFCVLSEQSETVLDSGDIFHCYMVWLL